MTIATDPRPSEADRAGEHSPWRGYAVGPWQHGIDVRDFIQRNYTAYDGDDSFLQGPTDRTTALWGKLTAMFPAERERGI